MKLETRLFYEVRKIYPELTAKQVKDFMATKDIKLSDYKANYVTAKQSGITVISDKAGNVITRSGNADEDVQKQIAAMAETKLFGDLVDGLLESIYDSLAVK
jgi:hypothetical protein